MRAYWTIPVLTSILILGILGLSEDAYAANVNSVQSGDWEKSFPDAQSPWSASPPNSGDNITILSGHTVTINDNRSITGTITIQPNAELIIQGATGSVVTLSGAAQIINNGKLTIEGGGASSSGFLFLTGTSILTNNGRITLNGGAGTASGVILATALTSMTNSNTILINAGSGGNSGSLLNQGTFTTSGTIIITGGVGNTAGLLSNSRNAFLENRGTITVNGAGPGAINQGFLDNRGTLSNHGEITMNGGGGTQSARLLNLGSVASIVNECTGVMNFNGGSGSNSGQLNNVSGASTTNNGVMEFTKGIGSNAGNLRNSATVTNHNTITFFNGAIVIGNPVIEDPIACPVTQVEVEIDIKPGSDPSSVNCKNLKGNVPVAIFGSATFDVSTIDLSSLELNGVAVTEEHDTRHIEDLDNDGFDDAVLHLDKAGVCDATSDNSEYPLKESVDATLTGSNADGDFVGTGDIRIVKR